MKVDMNPLAVTIRLKQTSELRHLCLMLGRRKKHRLTSQSSGCKIRTADFYVREQNMMYKKIGGE